MEGKACGGKVELQKGRKMGGIREFLSCVDLVRVRRAVGQDGKEQPAGNTTQRKWRSTCEFIIVMKNK